MKKYLPRLKQFFSNKKIIIILLSLFVAVSAIIIRQIFFTSKLPKVIYYTPANNRRNYFAEPTPIIIDTTSEFSVTENKNEYLVSNPYDVYFDNRGNIFYVVAKYEYNHGQQSADYAEYKLFKYSIDTKKREEIKPDNISGVIHEIKISKTGVIFFNNAYGLDEEQSQYNCFEMPGNPYYKGPDIFSHIYQIENTNITFKDKINCKDSILEAHISSYLETKDNKKMIISKKGDSCEGELYFQTKNEEKNIYETSFSRQDLCGEDGFSFLGYVPEFSSVIISGYLGEYGESWSNKIILRNISTLKEKDIMSLNSNDKVTSFRYFITNNQNYLSLILNNNKLSIINLNNNEKIIDQKIDNNQGKLNIIRNLGDQLLIETRISKTITPEASGAATIQENSIYQCFNFSAKNFVATDACGDPQKIYLGQWKDKKVFRTSYTSGDIYYEVGLIRPLL